METDRILNEKQLQSFLFDSCFTIYRAKLVTHQHFKIIISEIQVTLDKKMSGERIQIKSFWMLRLN